MDELKNVVIRLIEIIAILSIGLLFTVYILKPIYENFGIQIIGNVWVIWFGVSYILFFFYTLIVFCISNERFLIKKRLTSVFFWLTFFGANYVVFIPFIKGENPF